MATIIVNYMDTPSSILYDSVSLYLDSNNQPKFQYGDFIKDWYNTIEFFVKKVYPLTKEPLAHSTSVYQFIHDGANFQAAYLIFEGENPILSYDKDYAGEKVELFVPKGENWTLTQLQDYCKNN